MEESKIKSAAVAQPWPKIYLTFTSIFYLQCKINLQSIEILPTPS